MKRYLPILMMAFFASCSTFYGGTTSSTGSQSISASPTELEVSGIVDTTTYRTVTFTNGSGSGFKITNMAFVDNDCGAFSVYNILDEAENVLYRSGDDVSVSVTAGVSVDINLQFSPTSCEITQYTTTFIVYYTQEDVNKTQSVSLVTTVEDTTLAPLDCPETGPTDFYDNVGDPAPSRQLPALAADEYYYLKVNMMRAYIKTTGSFASFATKVGTDINQDAVNEEDRFQSVYLPLSSDGAGAIAIQTIDECAGFIIPSPVTDQFFIGAGITVTTANELSGTVKITLDDDGTDNIGQIDVPDFTAYLKSYINNSQSLLQNVDGYFGVSITADLTTGTTESNSYLADVANFTDDEGGEFMNVLADGDDSKLQGSNLRHGLVTLVGIGAFNADDALLSPEGYTGIIENEAYLFLQIDGQIVTTQDE